MMRTMDCTDIKVLLSGLVDDELDGETRHAAERHVAECASCRALLDEAEALNQAVRADAESGLPPGGLPEAFAGQVLSRTVYADRLRPGGGAGWINWLGWLAAAASLVLAITIWAMDRRLLPQSAAEEPAPVAKRPASVGEGMKSVAYQSRGRSWVFDGELPGLSEAATPAREASSAVDAGSAPDGSIGADRATAESEGEVMGSDGSSQRIPFLREDAETLDATALLVDRLIAARTDSFADLEQIRRIAEYDELLGRLEAARQRLEPRDRGIVLAAEGFLLRIIHGPINHEELQTLRMDLERAGLAQALRSIAGRWQAGDPI